MLESPRLLASPSTGSCGIQDLCGTSMARHGWHLTGRLQRVFGIVRRCKLDLGCDHTRFQGLVQPLHLLLALPFLLHSLHQFPVSLFHPFLLQLHCFSLVSHVQLHTPSLLRLTIDFVAQVDNLRVGLVDKLVHLGAQCAIFLGQTLGQVLLVQSRALKGARQHAAAAPPL